MGNKVWRIRDAVHNLIEFDEIDSLESRLWRVIQTPAFQRLRRVRQLGFSEFVYPGATHTRFAHSIGVFHAARRLVAVIKKFEARNGVRYEDQHAAPALAAALLHDVGHGMFSHAFEKIGEEFGWAMAKHEDVSQKLIREGQIAEILDGYYDGFAGNVAEVLKENKDKQIPPNIFHAIVSGQFDADKLDYMQRDRLMTGVGSSYVDMEWLLANLEVGDIPIEQDGEAVGHAQTLVLGAKAKQTAENYVFSLFHLYPNVYLHKTTRGFEVLFQALLRRLVCLADEDKIGETGLAEPHPLIKFIQIEQSKAKAASGAEQAAQAAAETKDKAGENLDHVIALDDSILWGSLPFLARAKDAYLRQCAAGLTERQALRAIDIRASVEAEADKKRWDNSQKKQAAIDAVCKSVILEIKERQEKQYGSQRCILTDKYSRPVYKKAQAGDKNAHLEQILIRNETGGVKDICDISPAIRHAAPYTICRAYLFRGDDEEKHRKELEERIGAGCLEKLIDAEMTKGDADNA